MPPRTLSSLPPQELRCCRFEPWRRPFLKRNLSYNTTSSNDADTPNPKVLFQFHTTRKIGGKVQVVSQNKTDFTCPLCGRREKDLDTLWMHMTTTNLKHAFSVIEDREGMIHIAANPDRRITPRISTVEARLTLANHSELIYSRDLSKFCRKLTADGKVLGPFDPDPSLREALIGSSILAPERDYYHPVSFSKITVGEWLLLDTIILPSDNAWEVRIANAMLDDFVDVSSTEKDFFKVWNGFVRRQNFISHKEYPNKCKEFISLNADRMQEFEEPWITHLVTLWEEHQISRDDMQEVMKFYWKTMQSIATTKPQSEERI